MMILSGVDEWVPRDPDCQSPGEEGNISGEMGIEVGDMNNGNNGRSEMITDLYSAPSQSM
jgi:hypothetical protein